MAIVAVRRHGLEPFDKVAAALPAELAGAPYARWVPLQARVAEHCSARLRKAGAVIDFPGGADRIAFGGIEAMSTLGLYQALKNWDAKARKAMRAYNRGDRP